MNINELEQLAKAATPGPWHWECDAVKNDALNRKRYQVTSVGKTITRIYYSSFEGRPTNAEDDAKYIAAANPSAIRELIAAYREAVAALEWCLDDSREVLKNHHELYGETFKNWKINEQETGIKSAGKALDTAKRLGVE